MAQGVSSKVDPPIVAPNGQNGKDVVVVQPTDSTPGRYDYMSH